MINKDNYSRLTEFGKANSSMNENVPFFFSEPRITEVFNYLDKKFIKRWVLNKLVISDRKIKILDVGAGTGRMARFFQMFNSSVIAIEPYPDFYSKLLNVCMNQNTACYPYTLQEYYITHKEPFDFIYVSGVLMYHNNEEGKEFLAILNKLIKNQGIIIIRDLGIENKTQEYIDKDSAEIYRSPKEIIKMASLSGLKCKKWIRPYPSNILQKIKDKWPNGFTNYLITIFTHSVFHPFWFLFALLNIPHKSEKGYFMFLFKKENVSSLNVLGS